MFLKGFDGQGRSWTSLSNLLEKKILVYKYRKIVFKLKTLVVFFLNSLRPGNHISKLYVGMIGYFPLDSLIKY